MGQVAVETDIAAQVPEKVQVALEEVLVADMEQVQVAEKVKIQMYAMKEKILQYHIIQT